MAKEGLVVVKFGSETTANSSGVAHGSIDIYARHLINLNRDYIVVTSGAEKIGRAIFRQQYGDRPVSSESLTTIGNTRLFSAWQDAHIRRGRLAGQMLITHPEIKDQKEGKRLEQTLRENLESGIATIINENDAVNDEEMVEYLSGGDNDELAYEVAQVMGATNLVMMTNVPGLLDGNGEVVRDVYNYPVPHDLAQYWAGSVNERGQGMPTKVKTAILAAKAGINASIASAEQDISTVLAGETGTLFVAKPHDM